MNDTARGARLVAGAVFLVLACLAFGPRAGAQNAPTASAGTVTTNEDTAYAFDAADFNFADDDTGDTLSSVRIVTLPATGALTRDGTAVAANQSIAVADIDADKLLFTPAANGNGDPYTSFTFKVSDGTDESASAYTMTVDVTAVNDAPTAADNTVATNEDAAYTFRAADFGFADVDTGGALASVRIATLPAAGSLTRDGTAVTANQSIAVADIDASKLVFTPAANGNGDPYASFTFKVSDGSAESASAHTMTVDVTAVNDAPTAAANTVTTNEDTGYSFAAGDFNFADVDAGDALANVRIVTLPAAGALARDGVAVTVNQSVSGADILASKLVFTPAANASGDPYTSFTFKVGDGTDESASAYTMTVDVTAVDDAPTAADNTVATNEDTAYTFRADDFGFADADAGDTLSSVRIVTLPAAGALTRDGTTVTANQSVSRADIDASKLVFTPASNGNGDPYASFTFKVSDGSAESTPANTMTVDVTAVNDVPTAAANTVTTNEDTGYSFAAGDFNFADADTGDTLANVRIVTLPAAGALTRAGTAVAANQSIAVADIVASRLVFTPAANASGDPYTSFTFKVGDGSAESASAYTMTVDVTAVNDAPTAADNTVATNEDTVHTFSTGDFSFADADTGDTLSSVKIVTLPAAGALTRDGTTVTANQSIAVADIDADKLVFTPAANGNGDPYASFTFKVSDGSAESAPANTMTVDVAAVNDVPTAVANTVATNEDTAYSFAAGDFNFADVDAGDTLASVRIVTLPAAGALTVDGVAATANQSVSGADIVASKLVFTPAANANGDPYASFTFKVGDGTDESASAYTMTVDVAAVDDAPTAADSTVATAEDTAYTFRAGDFPFADADTGDTLSSVRIVTLPAAGALTMDGTPATENQSIAVADIDADKLVFTPAANGNGDPYASFTFKVSDGSAESAPAYTMTVDVAARNDVPTAAANTVVTAEDTAHIFSADEFGFADVDAGDALAGVTIATLPTAGSLSNDGGAVAANQTISRADIDAGRLVFTPAPNAYGDPYASFTFKVSDGSAESVSAYTMTVDVAPVNDPPTAADNTVTTVEDTAYSFRAADFNFSDVEADDALASVRIVTLPALGSLTGGGAAVTANQSIARADIDAGGLVFTPAPNGNGDPYTSFTFRVSDGMDESAAAYTMTIDVTPVVETAMLQAWSARVGRTIGGQVVNAVTTRFADGGGSQVTLGGQRIGGPAPGGAGRPALAADRPGRVEDMESAVGRRTTRGMTGKELLRGSTFRLSGGEAGEDGAYAVWGRVAAGGFDARVDGMKLESDVTTGILGVDGEWGDFLAGVAVALSESRGGFRQAVPRSGGTDRGTLESGIASLYHYARVALSERLSAWGLVGYGAGELRVRPEDQAFVKTKLTMRMGALGAKSQVLDGSQTGGLRFAVKSDAMWVRTESEKARSLDNVTGEATRLRLVLEAERDYDAIAGTTFTPSGEIGVRHDGGDAETGLGVELGGGLRFAFGTLTVESRARFLVLHAEGGHEEWGASGAVALAPDASGRGPSFSLRPVWGQADSGTTALWSPVHAGGRGTGRAFEAAGRLDGRLGYGFAVFGDRLTVTPELGLGLSRAYRRYSLGWRLGQARRGPGDFDLRFEATRHEAANDDRPPEHGVSVWLSAGW